MQLENPREPESKETVGVYRTRWLIAHNRLHKIVQDHPELLKADWDEYLHDLDSAEAVAEQAA